LAFFVARKKALRRTPKCLRGLTVVKAGGDLSHSKLKGAIAPDEILAPLPATKDEKSMENAEFSDVDPKDGFSVRNFQIQAAKLATVSDIVVYRDNRTPLVEAERLAKRCSRAQAALQKRTDTLPFATRQFNTFVVSGTSCCCPLQKTYR
jgi:dual specificity MAP kinase phosphatase